MLILKVEKFCLSRTSIGRYVEATTFQMDEDSSADHNFQESSSPKMAKSPSFQRAHGFHAFQLPDAHYDSQESPEVHSPSDPVESGMTVVAPNDLSSVKKQDSFLMRLPKLPKVNVHSVNDEASNKSDSESPISRLLTSDPQNEHSYSHNFSRPLVQLGERSFKQREPKTSQHHQPSVWRLVELSFPEWLYALLGSIGAAIFGSFNPLFAYAIALIVASYYRISEHDIHNEVNKWCLLITCMGIITVVANFLQHFYFGIMGEKMTERVRRMMFSGKLLLFIRYVLQPCPHSRTLIQIFSLNLKGFHSCLKMLWQN